MIQLPALPPFLHQLTAPTPCADDPETWHADTKAGKRRAKERCGDCPVLTACLAYALDHPQERGVWGGTTRTERGAILRQQTAGTVTAAKVRVMDDDDRLACGTDSAWWGHRARGEEPDPRCQLAHEEELTQQRRARLVTAHEKGGTVAGWHTHRLLGEEPCGGCRGAQARKSASQRAARASRRLVSAPGSRESREGAAGAHVPAGAAA